MELDEKDTPSLRRPRTVRGTGWSRGRAGSWSVPPGPIAITCWPPVVRISRRCEVGGGGAKLARHKGLVPLARSGLALCVCVCVGGGDGGGDHEAPPPRGAHESASSVRISLSTNNTDDNWRSAAQHATRASPRASKASKAASPLSLSLSLSCFHSRRTMCTHKPLSLSLSLSLSHAGTQVAVPPSYDTFSSSTIA